MQQPTPEITTQPATLHLTQSYFYMLLYTDVALLHATRSFRHEETQQPKEKFAFGANNTDVMSRKIAEIPVS